MYIHLLYGDTRLFTNVIKPIDLAFFKVKVTAYYGVVISQTLLVLHFSFDKCQHM